MRPQEREGTEQDVRHGGTALEDSGHTLGQTAAHTDDGRRPPTGEGRRVPGTRPVCLTREPLPDPPGGPGDHTVHSAPRRWRLLKVSGYTVRPGHCSGGKAGSRGQHAALTPRSHGVTTSSRDSHVFSVATFGTHGAPERRSDRHSPAPLRPSPLLQPTLQPPNLLRPHSTPLWDGIGATLHGIRALLRRDGRSRTVRAPLTTGDYCPYTWAQVSTLPTARSFEGPMRQLLSGTQCACGAKTQGCVQCSKDLGAEAPDSVS
ncbi:uncharacterized protein LOC115302414 [Suricata suricatta]|uniref:uncharacterized protein LOC115302414 n=1 Tax=Suricata suricatta TaxID=37032 RepID=UPI0011554D3F|nr:uncharacterized protein LOC115302414 [Suricata suricatta]